MRILPHRRSNLGIVALSIMAIASLILLTAAPAFGQEVPGGEVVAALFYGMLIVTVIPLCIYLVLATQAIAKKTNTPKGWLAWIPIANFVLWANIARKPIWWGFLCLVPFANMVFTALLWIAIAEARKKPNWWGILVIVPVVQLIVPGYLAWTD